MRDLKLFSCKSRTLSAIRKDETKERQTERSIGYVAHKKHVLNPHISEWNLDEGKILCNIRASYKKKNTLPGLRDA